MKDNLWLDEVAETCTITLNVLQKKAETMGRLSHADQTMTDLCLGYLYLLSICFLFSSFSIIIGIPFEIQVS